MKILRSVTRRGFSVGTAGWFTVLRPNTWFPASRLPGSFHHPIGHSNKAGPAVPGRPTVATIQETTAQLQFLTTSAPNHPLMGRALIVLAAAAITSALLLWIIRPF